MSAAIRTVTGELRWNIKQSFRDYVAELPDGAETWSGDVGGVDGSGLVFGATSIDEPADANGTTSLKFGGIVSFQGYHRMLQVTLSDPWIEIDDDGRSRITANVAPAGSAEQRAAIAVIDGEPDRDGDTWRWSPASTRLTVAGAAVLGSVYAPGSEADGFSMTISAT